MRDTWDADTGHDRRAGTYDPVDYGDEGTEDEYDLVCPFCDGDGREDHGGMCPACAGEGVLPWA